MTKLEWGTVGERYYETGIDRGVLYLDTIIGVVWNGLVSVSESPSGGEPQPYYMDGFKFLNLASVEEYEATIEAFSSPREFDVCDGIVSINNGLLVTHQPRKSFGLCYRTKLGNDVEGQNYGYKLHLIYNALAAPSERNNSTTSDSEEPIGLSWEITTMPPLITTYRPTAHLVIDSRLTDNEFLVGIEDILYGNDVLNAHLPTAQEVVDMFKNFILDGGSSSPSELLVLDGGAP